MPAPRALVFLFIGGEHQVLHLAPVAAEISRRRPDFAISCLCADAATAAAVRDVARTMRAPAMAVHVVHPPAIGRLAARWSGLRRAAKVPLLARIRWRARRASAIVVPERTSATLRLLGWRRLLIHVRHGAGDRAPASEARLKAFDAVLVPGAKDVARAIARGVEARRIAAVGYVKLDYLAAAPRLPAILPGDRPMVFYNPHFDPAISSIGMARAVIERFRAQDRYALIFAPHVRTFEDLDERGRDAWRALGIPGRILIDLGSPRLFDMTYARAADIYLGDMSSQLYEFLVRPRPAAFIDAHGAAWRDDPRYAGWRLGEVTADADDVIAAVDRAIARQPERAAAQAAAVAEAFGAYRGAIGRAADAVLALL